MPDDILTNPESGYIDPRNWFGEPTKRFELEIGSGKGTFLIQQADLEPGTNFLGIEWAGEFYAYAADRVRRKREAGQLRNVRLLNADATEFLRWRVPPGTIRVVHLYFSDPWPKSKHHKKRVIQHRFLYDVWRALELGGELRVVTDHDELWAWDCAHFKAWTGAVPTVDADALDHAERSIPGLEGPLADLVGKLPTPPYELAGFDRPESAGEGELVGTNFERKFRREGRSFHACVLRKRG